MKSDSMPPVYDLWDELGAFPASRTDDALVHLMRWFETHLKVDNVLWLGILLMLDGEAAREDPFNGWRIRARKTLRLDSEKYRGLVASYFSNEHYGRLTPAFYRKGNGPDAQVHVGMASEAIMREAGTFRVHRLRDGWIDYEQFRETEHYRLYYEENDIADRIWVVFPVSPTAESIFLLDRFASGPHATESFTAEDAALAGSALRGAREFHRRLLLRHGVLGSAKALSPLKLRLLQELLSGRSEKEIASALGHNPKTMREYVQEIYAGFGVRTRPALMALWLGES